MDDFGKVKVETWWEASGTTKVSTATLVLTEYTNMGLLLNEMGRQDMAKILKASFASVIIRKASQATMSIGRNKGEEPSPWERIEASIS